MATDVLPVADDRPLYPPPPACALPHRARPGLRYRLHLVALLAALMLFLAFYLVHVVAVLAVLIVVLFPPAQVLASVPDNTAAHIALIVLRLGVAGAAGMFLAFLVKGFLNRQIDDTRNWVEISAADEPALFDFIARLCAEIGCARPARVFLNHDANAAVSSPTSIANLFVASGKDLLIGLGLVNFLDLVEFKALLAHEFGHLTQRELRLTLYVHRLYQVVHNMVHGRDRWDDLMVRAFDMPVVSAFLVPLYMLVDGTRALLRWLWRLLDWANRGLAWQMEYNADLVAVGAAGREAALRLDHKGGLAQAALHTTAQELALAAEHALYSRDLFYHQRQAARNIAGDLSAPASMYHPSSADRRRNVETLAVPSPEDDRPAWLLFRDTPAVREEVTRQFYWIYLHADPETLVEPETVQTFLREERGAATIDTRYRGAYDDRYLEIGDIEALVKATLQAAPPAPAELARQLGALYGDELAKRVADRRRLYDEAIMLDAHCPGRVHAGKPILFRGREYPHGEASRLFETVRAELDAGRPFFETFDRTVFVLHSHLADEQGRAEEYRRRYRCHIGLQLVQSRLGAARDRLDDVLRFIYSGQRWSTDQLGGLLTVVDEAIGHLDAAYAAADGLVVPPLEHVPGGKSLRELLPPKPETATLATTDAVTAGAPLATVHRELMVLFDRVGRLWVKSMSGILAMQEELVRAWSAEHFPGGMPPAG